MADARAVRDAAVDFLHDEAVGGLALVLAALAAVVWANLAGGGYEDVWTAQLDAGVLELDLRHWINDGAMALFFFVVGLEIKRELVTGELRDPRAAALPAIAAAGGVLLPVLVFLAVAGGGEAARGWAIPAATDIAFAIGVLALLGDRVSSGVRLLLLSIAIVDDIIAIAIIAVVYTGGLSVAWAAAAAVALAAAALLRRHLWAFGLAGLLAWFATHESGVHATVAGVALGLLVPAHPVRGRDLIAVLEHRLHLVSALVVVPLFALANAGVDFGGGVLGDAFSSALTWAVVAGLVAGKLAGVAGGALGALRSGAGSLPEGVERRHLPGVGGLAGIGFTVSLFIAGLAYDDPLLVDQAKVGIFAGSLLGAALGLTLLLLSARAASARRPPGAARPQG